MTLNERVSSVFTQDKMQALTDEQKNIANTMITNYINDFDEDYLTVRRLQLILEAIEQVV